MAASRAVFGLPTPAAKYLDKRTRARLAATTSCDGSLITRT